MISPFCDYLRFDYDLSEEPLFMCGEVDGVRVFSRTCHRFIRCVRIFTVFHRMFGFLPVLCLKLVLK